MENTKMKIIKLITLTVVMTAFNLSVCAQPQKDINYTYSQTEVDLKLQLQQNDVKGLQKDFDALQLSINNQIEENICKQDKYIQIIDKRIDRILVFIGILVTIIVFILGYWFKQQIKESEKEVKAELEKIKVIKAEIEEEKNVIEEIKTKVKEILESVQESEERVKKSEERVKMSEEMLDYLTKQQAKRELNKRIEEYRNELTLKGDEKEQIERRKENAKQEQKKRENARWFKKLFMTDNGKKIEEQKNIINECEDELKRLDEEINQGNEQISQLNEEINKID